MFYLIQCIFYGIPILAILFLASSLYRYIHAKCANKKEPGTFSAAEMKKRKILLIVSSVIMGVLVLVVIGFTILLYLAVANM